MEDGLTLYVACNKTYPARLIASLQHHWCLWEPQPLQMLKL